MNKTFVETLHTLAKLLNEANIKWSLGGSLMLHYYGIDIKPQDIDILVDESMKESLDKVLEPYDYNLTDRNELYSTSYFYSLKINDIDIDIMLGFRINLESGIYEYPFNTQKTKTIHIMDEPVYLSSIDEWLIAYSHMKRTNKIELIKKWKSQ